MKHSRTVGTAAALLASLFIASAAVAEPVWTWTDQDCAFDHPTGELQDLIEEIAPRGRRHRSQEFAASVLEAECEYGIESLLLIAVMERESHFDTQALGPRGSVGVMQVKPSTARAIAGKRGWGAIGSDDLEDVRLNVRLGTVYLSAMYRRFGDWEAALTAYNMGPSRLRELMRRGVPATSEYARAILARRQDLVHRVRDRAAAELAENR